VKDVATSAAHRRADRAMKHLLGGMMEVEVFFVTRWYVARVFTTTWSLVSLD